MFWLGAIVFQLEEYIKEVVFPQKAIASLLTDDEAIWFMPVGRLLPTRILFGDCLDAPSLPNINSCMSFNECIYFLDLS